MSKKDWKKSARIDYETSDLTHEEIAIKYKKSISSVQKYSAKEKWSKKKDQNCKDIEKKIEEKKTEIIKTAIENKTLEIEKTIEDEITIKKRINKLANKLLDGVEEALENKDYQKRVIENKTVEKNEYGKITLTLDKEKPFTAFDTGLKNSKSIKEFAEALLKINSLESSEDIEKSLPDIFLVNNINSEKI